MNSPSGVKKAPSLGGEPRPAAIEGIEVKFNYMNGLKKPLQSPYL
jgi:hypothetical protein